MSRVVSPAGSLPDPAGEGFGRARSDRVALATAAGTAASRLTGLLRVVMVAYAVGGAGLGDAFNLANNTPNMIHDLVLGGILAATFVPVFVDRLARAEPAEAERSIAAVITASVVLLLVATVLFELAAPLIVDLYTFGSAPAAEHALAVTLLRYFAPQLLCYGAISLIAALLATRHSFVAAGVTPVVNNLVGTVVLAAFAALAGSNATVAGLERHPGLVSLLGLGTTLAVAMQALALWPSLRRSGIRLRPVWSLHDPAMRTIVQLSGWTLGFIAANQLAVFVVLALEFHTGAGGVSAYTYAYTFFQLPFGIVAVSVVNVASPDLARCYSLGRLAELGERFGTAARQVLALVLPAAVGYLVLARQVITLVIGHGVEVAHGAAAVDTTAATLAMFALGLPAFCLYFLAIRAFQSMRDTRTAFVLYSLENGTNILVALLVYRTALGVRGLALSYSIAYVVGSLAAFAVLRERLGFLGGRALVRASLRSLVLSVLMAVAVSLVAAVLGGGGGVIGWGKLLVEVVVGALVYLGGAGLAGSARSWQTSRRHAAQRARRPAAPGASGGGAPGAEPRTDKGPAGGGGSGAGKPGRGFIGAGARHVQPVRAVPVLPGSDPWLGGSLRGGRRHGQRRRPTR